MKTYDSYEHARIENPEGDIAVNADGNLFVHTDDLKLSDAFAFEVCAHDDYCNPKQGEVWRCILLPRQYVIYLYRSHEGWDTEWVEGTLLDGQSIKPVQKLYTQLEVGHNILRAAALENQMNIDNLATQTLEEKEALAAVDFSRACEIGRSKLKSNPVIQLSIDEIDKFSGDEWNGEGLPPVGALCKVNRDSFTYRVMYSSEYVVIVQNLDNDNTTAHGMDIILDLHKGNYTFSKPESPQQREERECLEAAYDLYAHWNDVLGRDDVSHISNFKEDDNYALFRFFIARIRNLI